MTPRKDHVLVEPIHERRLSIVSNIIDVEDKVAPHLRAKVIKFGPHKKDPGFVEGDLVEVVPHGGTAIHMAEGHPDRLLVPINDVLGVWEG